MPPPEGEENRKSRRLTGGATQQQQQQQRNSSCDIQVEATKSRSHSQLTTQMVAIHLLIAAAAIQLVASSAIVLDHRAGHAHTQAATRLPGHLQPASVFLVQNETALNLTHLQLDELTGSIYIGATNWLFQLSAASLQPELALRLGPAHLPISLSAAAAASSGTNHSNQQQVDQQQQHQSACPDCTLRAPTPLLVDFDLLPVRHIHPTWDLQSAAAKVAQTTAAGKLIVQQTTMHTTSQPPPQTLNYTAAAQQLRQRASGTSGLGPSSGLGPQASQQQQQQQQQQNSNNYNKILAIDPEARQLIVCGSLNQGSCRRHQLGNLANFTDLYAAPVASNDEHASLAALVVAAPHNSVGRGHSPPGILYVAATHSRLDMHRELVPAISARHLDQSARAMQIIESSIADSARVDVSSEARDYYLINYVAAFQHRGFVYFGQVQRKSPSRQLEEWGFVTRLSRLCLNDLSFQSYAELTLECRSSNGNYNLLQDAQLAPSSAGGQWALVGAFAQSKDHTTRSANKSAICSFPMDQIELSFAENINLCLNGTVRSRQMNYIAGSVSECPRPSNRKQNAAAAAAAATPQLHCSGEPIRLNGSLPLVGRPLAEFPDQLVSSVASTLAPTGALGAHHRHHQVLIVGTADGKLKRLVVVSAGVGGAGGRQLAREFDSVQLHHESILADLQLQPARNPQLAPLPPPPATANNPQDTPPERHQFALVASAHKIARLRVNGCKLNSRQLNSTSAHDQCLACAHAQDPFCGWCASSASCSSRDDCQLQSGRRHAHWTPFDSIKCHDYQPVAPAAVPLESAGGQPLEVNVRLERPAQAHQLAAQLAQARFSCHFDFSSLGGFAAAAAAAAAATTSSTQARLNQHTGTIAIGCPLPARAQRPQRLAAGADSHRARVRLQVRLMGVASSNSTDLMALEQALGLSAAGSRSSIEREIELYDCSAHSQCRSCVSSAGGWCSWCPMSGRCTSNASHPEFGCAASAMGATTPQSASGSVRGGHLSASLDRTQASLLAVSLDKASQCPAAEEQPQQQQQQQQQDDTESSSHQPTDGTPPALKRPPAAAGPPEILIPNNVRRSVQVQLSQPIGHYQQQSGAGASRVLKLECLLELEGTRSRYSARLLDQNNVACQEIHYVYQTEVATLRAHLRVLMNDNQVIETTEVLLYKCHQFGVNPPALVSSLVATGRGRHSSAFWMDQQQLHHPQLLAGHFESGHTLDTPLNETDGRGSGAGGRRSDCSLCASIERKFHCSWCGSQCVYSEHCGDQLAALTCPPPRIDSIRPLSGPIEGGTLVTIEGQNLGSSEREIEDKISIGGEPCELLMYSVATRIVCKTAASLQGPQAATVFVGNRAGVTSALDKFHYKQIHLGDVFPRAGPISGGTRLLLTGANLNSGSRVDIQLDEIPCQIDGQFDDPTGNQLACITAPQPLAGAARVSKLTLTIDNSTHQLPYPFTYLPDPIITAIEPAESFVSGGRLILVAGQHLSSPQSIRLLVYQETGGRRSILNGTSCLTQNDTLVTCLTPALSVDTLAKLRQLEPLDQLDADSEPASEQANNNSATRVRMMLAMDDVKSGRHLDEYYHHLPHFLTYRPDPILFASQTEGRALEFAPELKIYGRHLDMRQLDQDLLVTVGAHVCPLRELAGDHVICEPPKRIGPILDPLTRQPVERPLLPIVALVGSNIRYQIGYMQYSSTQFIAQQYHQQQQQQHHHHHHQQQQQQSSDTSFASLFFGSQSAAAANLAADQQQKYGAAATLEQRASSTDDIWLASAVGVAVALAVGVLFVLVRLRQMRAEREYKRIQLQMGSLDGQNQPLHFGASFLDKFQLPGAEYQAQPQPHSRPLPQPIVQSIRARALDYVGGALGGSAKKSSFCTIGAATFAPSPLTDISSLVGSSPRHQQHVIKLASNGTTIINTTTGMPQQQQQHSNYLYGSASSSQSSPGSVGPAQNQSQSRHLFALQQQQQQAAAANKCQHLLTIGATANSARNWTQEAPSTIVPYAVIEAADLSLKTNKQQQQQPVKEYV